MNTQNQIDADIRANIASIRRYRRHFVCQRIIALSGIPFVVWLALPILSSPQPWLAALQIGPIAMLVYLAFKITGDIRGIDRWLAEWEPLPEDPTP